MSKALSLDLRTRVLAAIAGGLSCRQAAQRFGVSESTVKSWVHRLRRRYRELLREEVAQTVSNRVELENELRHLLQVLSS